MGYLEEIKEKIGDVVYEKLNKLADNQVSLAITFPLKDKYNQDRYFSQTISIVDLLEEFRLFEERQIKISPLDVINILFKCKLIIAIKDEAEYRRRNDGRSYPEEYEFLIPWEEKALGVEQLIEKYFNRQKTFIRDRVLVTQIDYFNSGTDDVQQFFEDLFNKIQFPFLCFFENGKLGAKQVTYEPGLTTYSEKDAKEFFSAPSFGFKVYGSKMYCYFFAATYLRSFFSLLRIASYIYPPQIDFGNHDFKIMAPISSVFLGEYTSGGFCWEEDKKEPWNRTPDGSLFLSFGYRGISPMWLDKRAFGGIEKFFTENLIILEAIRNPWNNKSLYDVAPTLDILSSATQIPDVGAKVLLVYCALEHLFVPDNTVSDNKKYVIGGINALQPDLLPWFEEIYKLRCQYAHKGFILKNESTRGITAASVNNVIKLLVSKLSVK